MTFQHTHFVVLTSQNTLKYNSSDRYLERDQNGKVKVNAAVKGDLGRI